MRRNCGRTERKNGRLSSWKRNGCGRKEADGKRKRPEKKGTQGTGREGKHLWNGCGSEAGKSERKRTAKLSTGTGVERMGNQAGENGESRRSESESGALRKPLRGGVRKQGKEAQRLSSQNPKLKRPKGSENSGGQKVDWIAAIGRVKVRPREVGSESGRQG